MNVVNPASVFKNQKATTHQGVARRRTVKLRGADFFSAILGFMLGQAVLLKGLSPFGIGFLAIFSQSPLQRLIMVGLGVSTGLVVGRGWMGLGLVVASILGLYLIRLLGEKAHHDAVKGAMMAGNVLCFYLLNYAFIDHAIYSLLMGIFEVGMIFAVSWLFTGGLRDILQGEIIQSDTMNVLALLFLVGGVTIGIPHISYFHLELQRILIHFILLILASTGGVGVGTTVGTFLGILLALTDYYDPVVIGMFAFLGLVAGFFRHYGSLAIILGSMLALLIFSGIGIIELTLEVIVLESLIAGGLFLLVPSSVTSKIEKMLPVTNEKVSREPLQPSNLQERFSERLDEFAQVFEELGTTFKEVTTIDEVEEDDISYFLYVISNRVCKGCNYESHCWDQQFYQTYTQIFKLVSLLENRGQAQKNDYIQLLKGHCRNLSRMKEYVGGSLEIYEIHRQWSKRLHKQQAIVADQLSEMSKIVRNFSKELDLCHTQQEELEERLKTRLMDDGVKIKRCHLLGEAVGEEFDLHISLQRCGGEGYCRKIFRVLNQMIPQPLTHYERKCGRETNQRHCYLKFCPARQYRVEVGFRSEPRVGESISGDNMAYQQIKTGKFMMILSDGMGYGEEAAKESRTAIRLVQRIIRAGFDNQLAVRTVNTALLSRSTEECFATLDMAFIDLFNGELELLKIGASASFIKRGYEVNLVRGSSLPVGILQQIEPSSFRRRLLPGDFIVMVSDGILDSVSITNKEDWMVRLLRQCSFHSATDLANYLFEQALGTSEPQDDMSVVVLKLTEDKF